MNYQKVILKLTFNQTFIFLCSWKTLKSLLCFELLSEVIQKFFLLIVLRGHMLVPIIKLLSIQIQSFFVCYYIIFSLYYGFPYVHVFSLGYSQPLHSNLSRLLLVSVALSIVLEVFNKIGLFIFFSIFNRCIYSPPILNLFLLCESSYATICLL